MRPLFLDDWRSFHPKGFVEWFAKIGGGLGITPKIPYHPIGGLSRVRSGYVNKDSQAPLGFGRALRTDYESFFYFQNLMLMGQSMGLGGWIHGSVFPPYIWQQDDAKGWHGLGFRLEEPKKRRKWPPVPASQANPVGIDGILEGLTPPYVSSMDEAVDRVVESKYSSSGPAYGNEKVFASSYRNIDDARAFLEKGTRFGADADRVHEGHLQLHLGHLRALPRARRRLLHARHVAAVLAPRARVLRPLLRPAPVHAPGGARQALAPVTTKGLGMPHPDPFSSLTGVP